MQTITGTVSNMLTKREKMIKIPNGEIVLLLFQQSFNTTNPPLTNDYDD